MFLINMDTGLLRGAPLSNGTRYDDENDLTGKKTHFLCGGFLPVPRDRF